MRIAYAQFSPVLGDLAANREKIVRLAERAEGVDLLVLPELSNSGYNFVSREQARDLSEEVGSGPFQETLREICAARRLHIVSGVCERDGDRLYNSAVLVGPGGHIGLYRKIHLFLNEKDIFQPGDLGFPVFEVPLPPSPGGGSPGEAPGNSQRAREDVRRTSTTTADASRARPSGGFSAEGSCRVGILICFDWQFMESWRVLALRGADIVCHPSNLVLPGRAQRAVPLHAMLNRLFVITANRIGEERGLCFTGFSLVAGPSGEILASASPAGEEVHWVDCDPLQARDKQVTMRNDLIADRRPEFYGELTSAPDHAAGDRPTVENRK